MLPKFRMIPSNHRINVRFGQIRFCYFDGFTYYSINNIFSRRRTGESESHSSIARQAANVPATAADSCQGTSSRRIPQNKYPFQVVKVAAPPVVTEEDEAKAEAAAAEAAAEAAKTPTTTALDAKVARAARFGTAMPADALKEKRAQR